MAILPFDYNFSFCFCRYPGCFRGIPAFQHDTACCQPVIGKLHWLGVLQQLGLKKPNIQVFPQVYYNGKTNPCQRFSFPSQTVSHVRLRGSFLARRRRRRACCWHSALQKAQCPPESTVPFRKHSAPRKHSTSQKVRCLLEDTVHPEGTVFVVMCLKAGYNIISRLVPRAI